MVCDIEHHLLGHWAAAAEPGVPLDAQHYEADALASALRDRRNGRVFGIEYLSLLEGDERRFPPGLRLWRCREDD